MSIIFGQDNKFTPAKVPTAVTPFQGVETVPVLQVAPKVSALDHFYAFDKNFQRTFDVFSKAIENKGYSVLDELETKKNQDIIDGYTTEDVASRNLNRYQDVASRGVIPNRTSAHKEFSKRHANATGLNVDAIAETRFSEFKDYVKNNPFDEDGIMEQYKSLENAWEGGQVWEQLEPQARPIIDTINANNQKRALTAAQSQLSIAVTQGIQDKIGAAPGTPAYTEGLRSLFADTNVVPDKDGNYDFLAIGNSFYTALVQPELEQLEQEGALDQFTLDALNSTLDEALVPIVQNAQKIIREADRAEVNSRRLQSKTLSLQGAIDAGRDISSEAAALLAETPSINSRGESISWAQRFASLVQGELDKPYLTGIPSNEGATLEEAEVNRIDRVNRFNALTTFVPEDITTFTEDYGDKALESISPTYNEFIAAGLDKNEDADIFQSILGDINAEYVEFRQGVVDEVKKKLAAPVLTTVESLLNASEGKFRGNPEALQGYFLENIAPLLTNYFPEEMDTVNGLFASDSNGSFLYRQYSVKDALGEKVDVGVNLWQSTSNPNERQPVVHDWQIGESEGEYFVYPGISNRDGSKVDLNEIQIGDDPSKIEGIFKFDSYEAAKKTWDNLVDREMALVTEARANTLQTEPNRRGTVLAIRAEMPLLNPLEQSIVKVLTSHDESLLRGMSGSSTAEPGDMAKLLNQNLDTKETDVTPVGVAKDSGRPSIAVLRGFNNRFVAPGGDLSPQWFDDVQTEFAGVLRMDPQLFKVLKEEYNTTVNGINQTEGLSESDKITKIAETKGEIITHLRGHIAAAAYVYELENARLASESTGLQNGVNILMDTDAQSSALRDILASFASNENKDITFNKDGSTLQDNAVFTTNEARVFINSALVQLNRQLGNEEEIYSFFGEYEQMVRNTFSITEEAVAVRSGADASITIEQDNRNHIEGSTFLNGQVAGNTSLAAQVDVTAKLILAAPGTLESNIMSLSQDIDNYNNPFMQASMAFLQNPSTLQEGGVAKARTYLGMIDSKGSDAAQLRRQFTKTFEGTDKSMFSGLVKHFEDKGINRRVITELTNVNSEVNQEYQRELQRQIRINVGRNKDELAGLQADQNVDGETRLYYQILQDSHIAALSTTFNEENGTFIVINQENKTPLIIKRDSASDAGTLRHAHRTMQALDAQYADPKANLTGNQRRGVGDSRYGRRLVQANIGAIADAISQNKVRRTTTVLEHGLSLVFPEAEIRQERALRIEMFLKDNLDETLAKELDILDEFKIYKRKRADPEFFSPKEIDQALVEMARGLSVKNMYFMLDRTTAGVSGTPSLRYSLWKNPDNYSFDVNQSEQNVTTFSITTTSVNEGIQDTFPFYFPKTLQGEFIPVSQWGIESINKGNVDFSSPARKKSATLGSSYTQADLDRLNRSLEEEE